MWVSESWAPLDNECKSVLMPEQLPGWHNVPIVEMLEKKLNIPVTLDYFAETALMGELLFQEHDLNKDIGLLWIDKGIGSSPYNRGKSSLHHRDQSALLAHQVIDFKGTPCVLRKKRMPAYLWKHSVTYPESQPFYVG